GGALDRRRPCQRRRPAPARGRGGAPTSAEAPRAGATQGAADVEEVRGFALGRGGIKTHNVVPAKAGAPSPRVSKGKVRLLTYWRHGVWVPAFAGTTLNVWLPLQHVQSALRDDLAVLQADDFRRQPSHLAGVVADIDHRHAALVPQADQIRQDVGFPLLVE